MGNQKEFKQLQAQIEKAEKSGKPIKEYVMKQIKLLKYAHEDFFDMAKSQGYSLNDLKLGEIEVQQYCAMKQLATKIGLPTQDYDEKIKAIRIRIFGEENYKRFFEERNQDYKAEDHSDDVIKTENRHQSLWSKIRNKLKKITT